MKKPAPRLIAAFVGTLIFASTPIAGASSCVGLGGDASPPPPPPPRSIFPGSFFVNDLVDYSQPTSCSNAFASVIFGTTSEIVGKMNSQGWSGSQHDDLTSKAHDWVDQQISAEGNDHQGADSARVSIYSGHSFYNLADLSHVGIDSPHSTLLFSRDVNYNGGDRCMVDLAEGGGISSSALGQAHGARNAISVFASSCTLNSTVWRSFTVRNFSRQYYGFEYSPVLNGTGWLGAFYEQSNYMPSSSAWILTMETVPGAVGGNAGPVVFTASEDFGTYERARRISNTLSLPFQEYRQPLESTATSQTVLIQNLTGGCRSEELCPAEEAFCDIISEGIGGISVGDGINQRYPASSRTHDAVGEPLGRFRSLVPSRTSKDVAKTVASLASSFTVYSFSAADTQSAIDENFARSDAMLRPVGGDVYAGYSTDHDELRVFNLHPDVSDRDSLDVDPLGASDIFVQALDSIKLLGLRDKAYYSTARPVVLVQVETELTTRDGASSSSITDYVYRVYREINGIPVLTHPAELWIHRSGVIRLLRFSGQIVESDGEPQAEVPGLGGSLSVRLSTRSDVMSRFNADFHESFPAATPHLAWDTTAYLPDPADPTLLVPMHVVSFVPVYEGGVISRGSTWAYSLDELPMGRVSLGQ